MLKSLHVKGFRTLIDTKIEFEPLTIMIGRNGVGKTTLLDALDLLGAFARGGVSRAFGPPPWSLSWQRSLGHGYVGDMTFELILQTSSRNEYKYSLALNERNHDAVVTAERLSLVRENRTLASYDPRQPPEGGSILSPRPDMGGEIEEVAKVIRSVVAFELNPAEIEKGTDAGMTYLGRDGFGVAGFLADLKDNRPQRFAQLEARLKRFRPETQALEVWTAGGRLYWGLRDHRDAYRAIAACHLSWGDRQLVGLLCILFGAKADATLAIEEIDRGFHPARYNAIIEMLAEASVSGLDGQAATQIIITTHSPSFINKLSECRSGIRLVTRAPQAGTVVRTLKEAATENLGQELPEAPLGEAWEMGLLEESLTEPVR